MATTKFTLGFPGWTDCGTTPASIQSISSQAVQFVIAASAPAAAVAPATEADVAAHVLWPQGDMSANIGIASKVYARAAGGTATLIVSRAD